MKIVHNKNNSTSTPVECAFSKYDSAVEYIQSAMDELNSLAKTDEVAKDAIVNLGVIMFDLRHD